MRSTPLIPEIASSIGSMTSRSTVSGEAPGYGIASATTGGFTSGNSSVSRMKSAAIPNTTRVSIATIVTTGFLIAKSEIHIGSALRAFGATDLGGGAGRDVAGAAEEDDVARLE